MLVHTNMTRGVFIANHASNYLPLRVKIPADKDKAISTSSIPRFGAKKPSNRNGCGRF